VQVDPVIADVRDHTRMATIIGGYRPFSVFHAAAHKHVPLMEANVAEAVLNNVLGTRNLVTLSARHDVQHFVLISTDKAVRPTSVMGATKRIAEHVVHECALERRTGYVSVRFGNVLGSRGSVVPTFMRQIADGGPVTITHPDMTRYFMTIPEASWLILDAAALGTNGDLFVLDMGEPIRIVDLARDLVRLAGRDPDTQPMDIVGIRPGEKLHEELFYDEEEVEPTAVPKVLKAVAERPPVTLRDDVRGLLAMATGAHEERLREMLLAYVGRTTQVPEMAPEAPDRQPIGLRIEEDDRANVATATG